MKPNSSNIKSGPSYGVYTSQLIIYARCCSHHDDFSYRRKCLLDRLLSQGYTALRLELWSQVEYKIVFFHSFISRVWMINREVTDVLEHKIKYVPLKDLKQYGSLGKTVLLSLIKILASWSREILVQKPPGLNMLLLTLVCFQGSWERLLLKKKLKDNH